MKAVVLATAVAAIALASPAAAATFLLGGPTGTPASVTVTASGSTLTLSGNRYSVAPLSLVSTTQFGAAANLSRSSIGIGVCTEGGNPGGVSSGECPQVDANGSPNEILRASFSESRRLQGLQLSLVDTNDTLRLYGLAGDGTTLNLLGFIGTISSGAGTGNGVNYTSTLVSNANGRTFNLKFAPDTPSYSTFFFTSNNDSVDGYRIDAISAAVPEPATWAMMISGFGLAGLGLRRSRRARTVALA